MACSKNGLQQIPSHQNHKKHVTTKILPDDSAPAPQWGVIRLLAVRGIKFSFVWILLSGGMPLFSLAAPPSSPGSAGGMAESLTLVEIRAAFGAPGGPTRLILGSEDKLPQPVASLRYRGSGIVQGQWEVSLPGPPPSDARATPGETDRNEPGQAHETRWTAATVRAVLAPVGSTEIRLPAPESLPRQLAGRHIIRLRITSITSANGSQNLNPSVTIPSLEYIVQGTHRPSSAQ